MSEDLTKDEFCGRFIARMLGYAPIFDGSHDELEDYAKETAPTYWDDPDQRAEGPEECAEAEASYWEGGQP